MNEPYKPNGTPLTDYERELLVILMEECAEVTQAASKLIRFGKENRPDGGLSNAYHLGAEMGDLLHMVELAQDAGIVRETSIEEGRFRKRERLAKYLQSRP